MNIRMVMVGVLAVVCGVSAMVLVQALRKPVGGPVVEKVPVVYAIADIKPGEMIDPSMVEVKEIPKDEAPEDAIHKPADLIDRAAQAQLDKGDMIREKKLTEKGAGRGMAALIKPGMRAFTIQASGFSTSMAGLILPGNRVDVLLTTNSSGGADDETGGATTTTLLQNVEILAVHTNVNTPMNNKIDPDQVRSVTLLVTPEQASQLDLGQNKGTLHFSLRNPKDTGSGKSRPATLADLNLVPPRPKPPAVETPSPAPAPAPAPGPVAEPFYPAAAAIQTMAVRTLRGTSVGSDEVMIAVPSKGAARSEASARRDPSTPRGAGPAR